MIEESKKFPAVITNKSILGIEKGTVLRFDWASGKYVSVTENEDIAEGDYYYSGYAIALDPYIVKDNIYNDGSPFSYIESDDDSTDNVIPEQTKDETPKQEPATEDAEVVGLKQDTTPHPLVIDCSCGHRNFLQAVDAPGVSITLMAEDENSKLRLSCTECGTTMIFGFASDYDYEYTKEKS